MIVLEYVFFWVGERCFRLFLACIYNVVRGGVRLACCVFMISGWFLGAFWMCLGVLCHLGMPSPNPIT